jgi:hypothetical protein
MISQTQLQAVADQIASHKLNDDLIALLRKTHTPIHFTYCMDDDIGEFEPVLSHEKFNLYLINSSEHCLSLSRDFETATGIVVAEIIADE